MWVSPGGSTPSSCAAWSAAGPVNHCSRSMTNRGGSWVAPRRTTSPKYLPTTSRITVEILDTTESGGLDYTAISEIYVYGYPQ